MSLETEIKDQGVLKPKDGVGVGVPDQVPKYLKAPEKMGREAPAAARSPAPSEDVWAPP